MSELDRDYDDYRRENRDRFERDFSSWREQRMHKRGMLGQVREAYRAAMRANMPLR